MAAQNARADAVEIVSGLDIDAVEHAQARLPSAPRRDVPLVRGVEAAKEARARAIGGFRPRTAEGERDKEGRYLALDIQLACKRDIAVLGAVECFLEALIAGDLLPAVARADEADGAGTKGFQWRQREGGAVAFGKNHLLALVVATQAVLPAPPLTRCGASNA